MKARTFIGKKPTGENCCMVCIIDGWQLWCQINQKEFYNFKLIYPKMVKHKANYNFTYAVGRGDYLASNDLKILKEYKWDLYEAVMKKANGFIGGSNG